MHIWLIAAFEPTPIDNSRPQRFMGIANAALACGHSVLFFSSTFKHSAKAQRFPETTYRTVKEDVYELCFIKSKPYEKNISVKRMLSHADLASNLLLEIKKQKKRPDVIFISLPPLSTVAKVSTWAKKNNIPVIVDIIDPWPEVFLKELPSVYWGTARIALFPFYNKLKTIIQASSGITAISEMYIKWAQEYSNDKKRTAFFYPAIEYDEVKSAFEKIRSTTQKDESKLRIIYAGSLASSYDIPTILKAAEIIEERFPGKVQFIIAGTGPQEVLIKAKNRKNVTFLGWLGQEEIYREFFLSHLGLIQHIKGATQSVTYKLFDYLGAGLPILNSLENEMWDIIEKNNVGINNKSGDVSSLATNIEKFFLDKNLLKLCKQNALDLTAQLGDSKIVYKKLITFIESVR